MTEIEDLANQARTVVRAKNAEMTAYRLQDTDTVDCDDVSPEGEFPEYGDFLDVNAVNSDGQDLGPRWLECPGGLARALVDQDLVEAGAEIRIASVDKDETGAWTFEVEDL